MYIVNLPRKWKYTGAVEITTRSAQLTVTEDGILPIYIAKEPGEYRNFRNIKDGKRFVVAEGEIAIFRNAIKGGYLNRLCVKENVTKKQLENIDALTAAFNADLEASFGLDDIELKRKYDEEYERKIKYALSVCEHIRTDEGFDTVDEYNKLSVIIGANSANSHIKNEGKKNNIFGIENLWQATNSSHACAFGFHSQWRATEANYNCSFGNETLDNNQTGEYNCAFGPWTMKTELENDWSVPVHINRNNAFGGFALYYTRGNDNNAFGFKSLENNIHGSENLALGNYSGNHAKSSREFYLDSIERPDNEAERSESLLYGTFNEKPENQTLAVNAGLIFAPYLPTEDPHVKGALYVDGDTIKISQW